MRHSKRSSRRAAATKCRDSYSDARSLEPSFKSATGADLDLAHLLEAGSLAVNRWRGLGVTLRTRVPPGIGYRVGTRGQACFMATRDDGGITCPCANPCVRFLRSLGCRGGRYSQSQHCGSLCAQFPSFQRRAPLSSDKRGDAPLAPRANGLQKG